MDFFIFLVLLLRGLIEFRSVVLRRIRISGKKLLVGRVRGGSGSDY